MNTSLSLAILATAALTAAPAQQSLQPVEQSLSGAPATNQAFDAAAAVQGLRDADLGRRMKTYEALLERARRDEAVRATVEGWAADAARPELAWTSQLLLRDLGSAPRAGRAAPPGLLGDPFSDALAPLGAGGMQDLMQRHDELMRRMEELFSGGSGLAPHQLVPGGTPLVQHGSGLSIEQGPDGVKVEVRETEDGQEQVQTYEAESLEELLEAHPELEGRIGSRSLVRVPGLTQPPDLDPFRDSFGDLFSGSPRTDRLGVHVLDSAHFTREVPGLDAGVGLEVVRVLPNSLGEVLGLRQGDVVTQVDGRTIRSVEDVKQALSERAAEAELTVDVVGVDAGSRTLTWTPDAPPARGPRPLQRL